uniref:hypothetical protein n=1 Tax=Actinoplanes rectilineatus TaxID=113571 RepID=UPI0005F2AFD2
LGIALLGRHTYDPRALDWLGSTPALAGCLGLWTTDSDQLELAGEYRVTASDAAMYRAKTATRDNYKSDCPYALDNFLEPIPD